MKKTLWSKLRFCFGIGGGRHGEEIQFIKNSKENHNNVNEEYREAFRTKSYTEISSMVHNQFETQSSTASSSSSPAPINLSECLLEPRQDTLTAIFESSNLHEFLVAYFEISLEASQTCESLLQNINQVRINHRWISKVLNLIRRAPPRWSNAQYHKVHRNLAAFAVLKSPFPETTRQNFHAMHNAHELLLHQLTSQCRKTNRRTKLLGWLRRGLGVGCSALVITLLLLSMHTMVGMVVAPGGLIVCSLALIIMKKLDRRERVLGVGTQLDIAAKGMYILINNLDTISRLVQGVDDEMDHRRFAADICVRKGKNMEMVKEVVGEFEMHESVFAEQLEELERHIYLCFVDINRSRRLLMQEMFK